MHMALFLYVGVHMPWRTEDIIVILPQVTSILGFESAYPWPGTHQVS